MEMAVAESRYYLEIFLEENLKKILVRVAGAPAEIRTEDVPNASLQRYY
jgi:hypothetical protein